MTFSYTLFIILFSSLGVLYITIDAAQLFCYNGSFGSKTSISLNNPVSMLNLSFFDGTKRTIFYAYGFNGKDLGLSVQTIVEAYLSLGSWNVCLLSWEKEASKGIFGDLSYPNAIRNMLSVAKQFTGALIKLVKAGLRLTGIRLIGFSLGAHLMGNSAKQFQQQYGQNISDVIGLDPAGPFFTGNILLYKLDATCAAHVIIFHTSPGKLGTSNTTSVATADVWPNCENDVQPGCTGSGFGVDTPENMCSHNRSWIYYGEALTRPGTFVGRYATSCKGFHDENLSNVTTTIEDMIDTKMSGNFYLSTNSVPYYGRGINGSYPNDD